MCNKITISHLHRSLQFLSMNISHDDYVLLWLTSSYTSTIKGKLLNFIKAVEHNNPFLLTAVLYFEHTGQLLNFN
ncbi:hypothetical protein T4B_2236 [Trichinella pseudospiralis]|uniref:Uncharacterized protein n=1 Tax=Trichinella pseudospiralis TaxID=6337 RepID=A0A0V1EEA9_TRIPS|nr:hypothetical protein T4A_8520 [Trichinella pseudospiralis]KRZ33019.1 hypothetical protein T4B_2236 [Trichinella pseudospiralis]KRZ44398.1 hypothetical protein T4C_14129 [Trichinella pseudospiralis]